MIEYANHIAALLMTCPVVPQGILAGGAVNSLFTGRDIEDFDFYFRSVDEFKAAVADAYSESWRCVSATDRSVTFVDGGRTIQFMHFEYFENAEAIFDAFDFTVCMGAYDFKAAAFVLHPDFVTDCSARRLRFHGGTRFPLATAMRVIKYQRRGYTFGEADALALAVACSRVQLSSWEDFERHVGGVYGQKLAVPKQSEFNAEIVMQSLSNGPPEVYLPFPSEPAPASPRELFEAIGVAA